MADWTNILTNTGVLVFVMYLFRTLFKRVNRLEDDVADAVRRDEFSEVSKAVSAMQLSVARIDERVKFLAEKNGYKQKD